MMRAISDWIEDRTGLQKALQTFMNESVPASTGWRNTLGSVAGALLLIQILSGVLLMIFYVPHPGAAYESLEFIRTQLRAGWLVRALHYWGASFIVAAIFLHMLRVFFSGAYKKPREITWLVGLALLGVVMGFAFTGQLLAWNQAGYWAAKVGIEIASSAPVLGPFIQQLLIGGEALGALTLTRFYTAHVVLLPMALGALVPLHLYLLRRHGPARPANDTGTQTIGFFPTQLARDCVTISVALAALFIVAAVLKGPHSGPIDPTDTSYVPRPEWYFLAHFEILRVTPGSLKIFATFVLPNLLLLALVALPWLDRSPSTALRARPIVVAAGTLVIAGIVGLTALGIATAPEAASAPPQDGTYDMITAGRERFEEGKCLDCHRVNDEGSRIAPNLSNVGTRIKEDYMRAWLKNPQAFRPDTPMPPAKVSPQGLHELIAYLQSLHGEAAN